MSGTWPTGWVAGDIVTAAEFAKGVGAIYNSTLGAPAASVDVTSIIAGYAHLRIVVQVRGDTAATSTAIRLRFNNDTGANYDNQSVQGATSSASAGQSLAATSILLGDIAANSSPAGSAALLDIIVANYAGTTFHKQLASSYGVRFDTSSTQSALFFGNWRSTAAINRVTLFPGAGNFQIGTRVTIYGMGS